MKDYFKYYICGGTLVRALRKEIAEKKFKKLGLDINEMRSFLEYKKAARYIETIGGYNYGKRS